MTVRGKLAWLAYRMWRGLFPRDLTYIFVLAHARSGSNLTGHILMSHPRIVGMGEHGAVYKTQRDMDRLAGRAHFHQRQVIPQPFVVDQMTHGNATPELKLLARSDVRLIFLIRQPTGSIASLMQFPNVTLETARAYYTQRLDGLCTIAEAVATADSAYFLTYERLTGSPDSTLKSLSGFLGLTEPLSSQYRDFGLTQMPATDKIHSGKISEPREWPELSGIDECWDMYNRANEIISRACSRNTDGERGIRENSEQKKAAQYRSRLGQE